MCDYDDLVKRLKICAELHGECSLCVYQGNPCDCMPETPLEEAADAIEKLVDDRKALKRLVERRKSVGKVPFDPKNSESRNAMIELHRIDSLIVDGVVFTFNNDKTSHMPLPEPPKEEKE